MYTAPWSICALQYPQFYKTSNILRQPTIISIASGTVNTTVSTTSTTTATTTTTSTTTSSTTTLLDHHQTIVLYMLIYTCNMCCSLQYILNTHGYEHRLGCEHRTFTQ